MVGICPPESWFIKPTNQPNVGLSEDWVHSELASRESSSETQFSDLERTYLKTWKARQVRIMKKKSIPRDTFHDWLIWKNVKSKSFNYTLKCCVILLNYWIFLEDMKNHSSTIRRWHIKSYQCQLVTLAWIEGER